MNRRMAVWWALACTVGATACSEMKAAREPRALDANSVATEGAHTVGLADDLQLTNLGAGLWIHTSFKDLPTVGRFPSNGLVLIDGASAVLIDTPWTRPQTKRLLAWLREAHGAEVRALVATHSHDDRVGGVNELGPNVRVYALQQTADRALKEGNAFVVTPLEPESTLTIARESVETYFPGAGHAPDNIVVWLPKRRVLFGGCFVRSAQSRDLGNLTDADISSWPAAAQRLLDRYAGASVVVPGHGSPGGVDLLVHTRELATNAAEKVR